MVRFGKRQAVRIGYRGLAVFVGCLLMAGAPAMAGPGGFYSIDVEVQGTNSILDGNGGSLYIPQMPGTSGELGDPLPGSSNRVGLDKDAINVSQGDVSQGWVRFILTYNIPYQPTADEWIEGGVLELTLNDLDFNPVDAIGRNFRESMELTFLLNATDTPGPVDITLDSNNYHVFSDLDPGDATDGRRTVYSLDLGTDLGVTKPDFEAMETDLEFGILMTVRSRTERIAPGGRKYNNTLEKLNENIAALVINGPEPVTGVLLAVGALGMLRRRRRTA